jgi:Holliday junction resolvasome RuvABC ATP-dependent DNA helicase subunit
LIDRTPRGRVVAVNAYQHLGRELPADDTDGQARLL